MKKIFYYIIAVVTVMCIAIVPAVATEAETEAITEDEIVETEGESIEETTSHDSKDVVEALKETLIILAESDTKGEAIDKMLALTPNATAEECEALIDSFIETSEWWDCRACMLYDLKDGLQYGLDAEWIEWYMDTYFPELPESCDYEETEAESETETTDIVAILGDADSRLDAIVKLAGTMGITLEEAEALLDKMVALGDEHFGEHDFWLNIRESIEKNPDTWTIAILTVLMLLALVIFLIRGLIKNTTAQATNKMNIEDIKRTEAVNAQRLTEQSVKLSGIENEHADIKAEIAEINARCELTQKATDIALSKVEDILTKAVDMLDKVEVIERNSANALKVNVEQALETVELLNIAMGRKLPTVSEATRKVWRDNAVSKIKAFVSEEQDATATEDKTKT